MSLRARITRRLDAIERSEPDGPLAGYRWLWRALERSSSGPVWALRLRFVARVVSDVFLLAGWWAMRGAGRVLERRAGAATVVVAAIVVVCVVVIPMRAQGGVPHVSLGVTEAGLVRYDGRLVLPSELAGILEARDVRTASLWVEDEATVGAVRAVSDVLVGAGVHARVRVLHVGHPRRTRR